MRKCYGGIVGTPNFTRVASSLVATNGAAAAGGSSRSKAAQFYTTKLLDKL